jgi:hypothetical protein
MFIVKE